MSDREEFIPEKPNKNVQHFEGATSTSKKVNKLIYLALALIALAIGVFLYWQFSNQDVLEVKNSPVPVSKISPTPTADGQVVFRVDFCKKVKARGTVRTSFVNPAREIFLPTYTDNLDKGCNVLDVPVIVPRDIVAAKYHVHYHIVYKVNPLRAVTEEFDSQEFEVK